MPLDDFDSLEEMESEDVVEDDLDSEGEDVSSKEESLEDVSAYLFLLELITVLNQLNLSAQAVFGMFDAKNLPPNLRNIFNLFVEKEQFLQSLSITVEKLEMIKAAAEGAMLATSALEFVQKLAESSEE